MMSPDLARQPAAAITRTPRPLVRPFDRNLRVNGLDAMKRLASALAQTLRTGDAVLLHGDLGAGKTEFARAMIQARMRMAVEVPSPTFTLVQTYATPDLMIAHADLYRVERIGELAELGLDEALEEGAIIVEWPERAQGLWPASSLELSLTIDGDSPARKVQISGAGDWSVRLADLAWDTI